MQRKIRAISSTYQPLMNRMITGLACACALSVFLYGVFLLEAVAHAASATAAQRSIGVLSARVGSLEQQFLSITQSLTPQKASEMGYVAPSVVTTVFASNETHALSIRVH